MTEREAEIRARAREIAEDELARLKHAAQKLSLKVGTPAFDYYSLDETYETRLLAWVGSQWDGLCDRANTEAKLAADLRVTQDQVIERCAQAIQENWPEAAKTLRAHVDGISGEDWGELNRELQALREENERLTRENFQLGRERWIEVCKCDVFQELKHGKYKVVLYLLQNMQISVGKAAQSIAEMAHGVEPHLPPYEEEYERDTALNAALARAEAAEQKFAALSPTTKEGE